MCASVCVCARVEDVPSDQMLGVMTNTNVVREIEAVLPIDYLAIDVPSILRAEWGPADETLKHNCAKRPLYPGPLALLARWKEMRYLRTQSQSNE